MPKSRSSSVQPCRQLAVGSVANKFFFKQGVHHDIARFRTCTQLVAVCWVQVYWLAKKSISHPQTRFVFVDEG